jgi:hypothetical protein
VDKQNKEAEIQARIAERQAKQNEPTTGMREALWATGNNEDQARQLLQNKIQNPLGMLNYQLSAQNAANTNTRQNEQLELSRKEFLLREEEARRKDEEAGKPKPLSDFQQYKMDEEMKARDMARKQSELSAQDVLDQAETLYNHPGRLAGTGMSSFVSKIPGTDAKGFASQLDTFKAQTFVPMVQALKGMGALSDAEGKKLSESVGALDPSMPEKEFADSLQNITTYLAKKAQISGLNVNIPKFADTGIDINITPETWQAMPPEQRKQLQDDIAKEQKGTNQGLTPDEQRELDELRARFNK